MLASIKVRVKNLHISRVETAILFLLLTFGLPMIVLIPPGAGYDEEDHLVRVWELSAFSFIPGQMSPQEMKYPIVFRDFAYRQQGRTGILGSEFWQKYARASLYEYGSVRREINTKSVYSPALLMPQALTLRLLGRDLDLPALPVFYACRFAGLFSYLILAWLAIRWVPFGKWILLILAASPMALFQAATISPDSISNGIGFLFVAGCLKTTEFQEINWREFARLVLLIFLLFLAKLNLIPLILLPFLLLPPSRFTRKGIYASLLATAVILFLVEVVGWYIIASARSDPLLANDANPVAQLRYMAGHPFAFSQTILKDLVTNGWTYFREWINGYGYYYWTPPQIVAIFFLLGVSSVLLMDSIHEQASGKFRIVFIFVFVMGYLATVGAEYTTFTPVGLDQVFGMQGRYFIPLAALLFLALAGSPWMRRFTISSPKWMILFLTTALSLNVLGIFLSFHVDCGSTFYQAGYCYRPLVFKDFPSEFHASQPVSKEVSLAQEIQVECNGLAEIRLWTLPSTPGDRASTRFLLRDLISDRTLLDTSIANDQIAGEDWYSLHFDPDWLSKGKQYLLEISSANTPARQGLKFLYTPQSEFDLGNLYENGAPMEDDLVLQYGCVTGLRKIWATGQVLKP